MKQPMKPQKYKIKRDDKDTETARTASGFPVVGIGASAGGLSAFEAFFSGMPENKDPDMAFVLVQHLAPDHKSLLTEIVKRYTRMQVFEVKDGMTVRPNCVYIIPPNRDMSFFNGALQLLDPTEQNGPRTTIDFFFRSLAQDLREKAIGVILTGTGSDGTDGIRAIKGEGGMVIAQKPDSTEYDGMPRSAIATGLVDYELPPAEMPAQILAYVSLAFGKPGDEWVAKTGKTEDSLNKIFNLLRSHMGHDFSLYKPNTIKRRIDRRMAVHQIVQIEEYIHFLRKSTEEVEALFKDLLINVTSFFRDPDAFDAIEKQIIPKLFDANPKGGTIRVWSVACSTGEEAYSIAILLDERKELLNQPYKIQVFATDIDSEAIAKARTGLYPASIAADITPERLSRYFVEEPDGRFRIAKKIRDMLIFSEQDVTRDPPFSRQHLICCRNLLIYLGPELQKRLIPLFHYALNPDGILFLGSSETTGEFQDLFAVIDRKQKIFQRKKDSFHSRRKLPGQFEPLNATEKSHAGNTEKKLSAQNLPLQELTEQAMLAHYAPTAALVNASGDILYLHGRTSRYLELAQGEVGVNNILKMAREGLQRDMTLLLRKAVKTGETVDRKNLPVRTNGEVTGVDLSVLPVVTDQGLGERPSLYLVMLEDAPFQDLPEGTNGLEGTGQTDPDARVEALQHELRAKEEYLQSTTEELETTNEELKSSNEEMQSINEELSSTNEELETSKEELQSVNEELATVNTELQNKVDDLTNANNDMNNLLAGTDIATIYVDQDLNIMRFTPTATRIINLIKSDIGRPVDHIASKLEDYGTLSEDIREVLDNLVPKESKVKTRLGDWYAMRIQPYRTLDNAIEGAVITFSNINELEKIAQDLTDKLRFFTRLFEKHVAAILLVDPFDHSVIDANEAAVAFYGWPREEMQRRRLQDLTVHAAEQLKSDFQPGDEVQDYIESIHKTADGTTRQVEMLSTRIQSESKDLLYVVIKELA